MWWRPPSSWATPVLRGRLDGKVAIITGAAQGTGEAIARRLAAEGASVLHARFVELDVRREEDWAAAVEAAVTAFSGVDILVNNAAVLLLQSLVGTSRQDFLRLVEVNQLGPYLGIQAVFETMAAGGGDRARSSPDSCERSLSRSGQSARESCG